MTPDRPGPLCPGSNGTVQRRIHIMQNPDSLRPDTLAVHGGDRPDPTGAVVAPIYQVSTFAFDSALDGAERFSGAREGFIYSRMLNPTVLALEDHLARLEGGTHGLACSSGMAAIHTALASLLEAGDHVICSEAVYGPTSSLLKEHFGRFGVTVDFVDLAELAAAEAAFRPRTKVLFLESPGNPTLCVLDIAALAKLAHGHGAKLIVDNTFLSPLLQRPFELGADLVVHSLTKFLNGHADVVAGAIICPDGAAYKRCRSVLNLLGGVIDPHQAWLVQRGVKTLALRMERHCTNAQRIAEWLEADPRIDRVWFPGLPSHPQHQLALRQQKGPGGMIACRLRDGLEAGRRLLDRVQLFRLAVSLGGVESLIQQPATMTHASMSAELRAAAGIEDGLIRLSVGVEDVADLLADLDQALGG
jgi:methionine-gamma-lyase